MRVKNKFNKDELNRKDRWDWVIYLEETPDDTIKIEDIKNVKYYLHKTFPNNILYSKDKSINFQKMGSGWGEFLIGVEIETENGKFYHSLYWLDLGFRHTNKEKKDFQGIFEEGLLSEENIKEISG